RQVCPRGPVMGPAKCNGQAAEHHHQADRDNRGIFVPAFNPPDKHWPNEKALDNDPQNKHDQHHDRNPHVPELNPYEIGEDNELQVTPDHVELAHGPVDHLHDAIDEGDPHAHQTIQNADDNACEQVLSEEFRCNWHVTVLPPGLAWTAEGLWCAP